MRQQPLVSTTSGARSLRPKHRSCLVVAALLLGLLPIATSTSAASAAERLTKTKLAPNGRTQGAKSPTSRLAQSDPGLLRTTDSKRIPVLVKLDYDSTVTYAGGVSGLRATSPSVTGRKFDGRAADVKAYEAHTGRLEAAFLRRAKAAVPSLKVNRSLRRVYGGVAVTLPGSAAARLLQIDGVVAIQRDSLAQPLTDNSPEFIGAPTLYAQAPPGAKQGEGTIVGVLDTGAWPEHPSFAHDGTLPAPPARGDGAPRVCDYGDNPLTPATDVFTCQRKLIGGAPFLDTYNAIIGGELYPDSARDSDGHGTHTMSTAAGSHVASAPVFGVDRGPIHGIAPRAHAIQYKVCGDLGCFSSDSIAAVVAAVEDGVDVINFSISGGSNPFTDPVELAFLDAFAAGVFVAASGGNSGPGAGTVNHGSPWVTTVAASTHDREFRSTVTMQAGGASRTVNGVTITSGISSPTPVVLASAAPYSRPLCNAPAPAGTFTGKIVVCIRGTNARVEKGFNVAQGGAVGMLLVNPQVMDVETDNHHLPTVHLDGPAGAVLLDFVEAHPGTQATFTAGQAAPAQGDVMAAFSSRGPSSDWLKPDVTAPGVQVLAGHTPTPRTILGGPSGQYFQAIAGTSMSSPHAAGSAALLAAMRPTWSPAQIKSALMTSATTAVVEEDGVTPADPFDMGAGRIDLTRAGNPGLTVDFDAADVLAAAASPMDRIDLNVPSINAPLMAGSIRTTRTFRNVSGATRSWTIRATSPGGSTIEAIPSSFTVASGASKTVTFTIRGSGIGDGQWFGHIHMDTAGPMDLHLPVAFERTSPEVAVTSTCSRPTPPVGSVNTCTVVAQNDSLSPVTAKIQGDFDSAEYDVVPGSLTGPGATPGGGQILYGTQELAFTSTRSLAGREPSEPTVGPGELFGYIPLFSESDFIPVGDEESLDFAVPPFVYGDLTYDEISLVTNGYAVVGGVQGAADIDFVPQELPDAAPPNNVLAPYWTDLNGEAPSGSSAGDAPGIAAALVTDGVDDWLLAEYRLYVFGTTELRKFQLWIGLNGVEDITYAYDPAALPGAGSPEGVTVGAENAEGNAGEDTDALPTGDLRVESMPGTPGASATFTYRLKAVAPGDAPVRGTLLSSAVRGKVISTYKTRVVP